MTFKNTGRFIPDRLKSDLKWTFSRPAILGVKASKFPGRQNAWLEIYTIQTPIKGAKGFTHREFVPGAELTVRRSSPLEGVKGFNSP